MRIVVTGATGGIGQPLTEVLAQKHEVTGVVRSELPLAPAGSNTQYVSYTDRPRLIDCLRQADVVVHAAINWKPKGNQFEPANRELTKDILDLALSQSCKLFVFFSSMVVYSGSRPASESGYREDQECVLDKHLDAYSRLKLLGERMVIQACERARVPYLILRPTAVLGPGLIWTRSSTWSAKRLPLGIKGYTMNLIHVDDLCRYVDRLIDLHPANEIFNLGGADHPSERFFEQAGKLAGRRMRFLPDMPVRVLARVLPSSLWLFKTDVRIDCRKVEMVTGMRAARSIEDVLRPDPLADVNGNSLAALRSVRVAGLPFKAYGLGYSLSLTPIRTVRREKRVLMEPYQGIVALHGDLVTVKAGTLLSDITRFLDQVDLTLATLPEFTGLTAGACFFVDVHGSSNEYFSLRDLIREVKYLDGAGNVVTVPRDDPRWDHLREQSSGVLLAELTFKCESAGFLTNRLEFTDDDVLEDYILRRHRENLSTTVQWFPVHGKCLVYNINRADSPPEVYAPASTLYRHMPYRPLKWFIRWKLRGATTQYGRYADILGNWKDLPLRKAWHRLPSRRARSKVFAVEMCMPLEDGGRFSLALKRELRDGETWIPKGSSFGFRFSYRRREDEEPEGFVWVEMVSGDRELLDKLVTVARRVSEREVTFHQGKYVPPDV